MLRSLYSGISGLRSHQTMLDVTGNNIANVNTSGFKASTVRFQDTLSQLTQGAAGPQAEVGGTNPAQVGLGVQLAGISTDFTQGSAQPTGRGSDLMISGNGFFITSLGGQTLYTRAGAFDFDAQGRLVTPDGAIVQGWVAVGGVIDEDGPLGHISLPQQAVAPAIETTAASVAGNLPADAEAGLQLIRDIDIFDAAGNSRTLTLTFENTGPGAWELSGTDGTTNFGPTALAFDANGTYTGPAAFAFPGIDVDLSGLTGFADLTTVSIAGQNGRAAGELSSYTLGEDGTLSGSFSNGASEVLGRIALASFVNPGGLEKAGSSAYRATFNSGAAEVGAAGSGGLGLLVSGAIEMSNVDLSQEFTNLIVAQRGFQANARIITTSDEVLQELANLKR